MPNKVLMLILASDNLPIYRELQSIWRKYMSSNPDIDCYFYKGDPKLTVDSRLDNDTLWIKIDERLDTVYEKTIKAFNYFSNRMKDYDFVCRPNLSSFFVFDKYLDYCSTLPKSQCVSAFVGIHDGISFPSGCGFTMSSDVVLNLLQDNPKYVVMDDVTIGAWLMSKNITIIPARRFDFTNDRTEALIYVPIKDIFHYRVKNSNRNLDILIHSQLLKIYYNVSI